MPLGREVGLSTSDIVLDEDPAPPPQKGGTPPIFSRGLLWPNGCMDPVVAKRLNGSRCHLVRR